MREASISLACDVDNPLTGPTGAAAVYGPQKGAGPDLVATLDRALTTWADVGRLPPPAATCATTPGAGAAGGIGFGAVAVLGARLRPGAAVVQQLTGLEDALAGVDLVITGEGSLDAQTLSGKAPAARGRGRRRAGVPVVAVAGRCLLDATALAGAGIRAAYALVDEASSRQEAFDAPGPLLERLGARIAMKELDR